MRFRRMPGLLGRARYPRGRTDEAPELLAPDGEPVADPTSYVRKYLDRDDEVAREGAISHFDQLPLSILTTATLTRPGRVRAGDTVELT